MTHHQAIGLRSVLENRLAELAGQTHFDGILVEDAADELDRRLLAREREIAGASLEVIAGGLREATAALRRFETGSYGECADCGEPISERRLKVLPWAVRCVGCQQLADCRETGDASRFSLPLAA